MKDEAMLGIPLMYEINSTGPSTDPCGTPLSTGAQFCQMPSTLVSQEIADAMWGESILVTSTGVKIDLCRHAFGFGERLEQKSHPLST